ncbi:hypothetical protein [Jeotgalibacillus salarius]|uniref:Uncharacterized protein n=1 Tax=Jeotgalibacillus salarius TaxID=546023 RepID=A0A4Y8LB70_9BACL|nr:hypothetical protein [Jeotgalibacillus salarius]TFD99414.1 hypothetical protein E2626_14225 [Jeotgalibacillus salarius]
MSYFQVTSEDITKLKDFELTKLLSTLLYNEAEKYGIVKSSVSVALNITVGDGGEDGSIKWENNIESTDWLPNRYTLFQVKATDMPPSTCKQEVLGPNGSLKDRVEDVIISQGSYILFHNKELNQKQILHRIEAIKEAVISVRNDINPSIEIYDANKIAEWCNQYVAAIYSVWEWNGKPVLAGSKTWNEWNGHKEFQSDFVSTFETDQMIGDLREYLKDEKKVSRIIGLPGKGKTRLALEVFRSDGSIDIEVLNKRVVYIDATYSRESIFTSIASWRNLGISGVLVVDNCDYELHKILKSEVEHAESKFSLLTIDYNLHSSASSDPLINLEDVPNTIIEGIIKNSYPGMSEEDLKRIVAFADGFPSIATLLAEARINDLETIGSIQDETLVRKLLWGRDTVDDSALKVIEACAVFEHLGFMQEKEFEMEYVAEHICEVSIDDFYEKCHYFIKKKIIVQHGRYIKLVPKTLAITLAAQWWEKCRPQKAQEILSNQDMPSSMVEQLCNQISKLHFLEKAKELTSSLCGIQAPFGQAEILSSKIGSRIFCSFVEIDPVVTVEALDREFGNMKITELKKVKEGRRDLVRSLEKLCFWEETFNMAAKTLAKFAAAENEHWSNNATGQFNQLFHYILSGTQADLKSRCSVITWAIFHKDKELKKIGIGAASHALKSRGFSRMIGVENQGTRPSMQEWKPDTWAEVFEYWDQIISILVESITKEDEYSDLICEVFLKNIFGLMRSGYVENIDQPLRVIFEKKNNYWPEFIDEINQALKFEGSKMPKNVIDLIKGWEDTLQPQDTITKVKLFVSNANDDYIFNEEEGSGSKYRNAAQDKIDQLIEEIYPDKANELESIVNVLVVGEQKQTFYFGKQISNKMSRKEKSVLLEIVYIKIKELLDSKENEQKVNMNLLGGILSSIQISEPELLQGFLTRLDNSPYSHILVELIRFIQVDKEILNSLQKHLKESIITADSLIGLAYSPALRDISEDNLMPFLRNLYELDEGYNQVVTWKIYYRSYLHTKTITLSTSQHIIYFLENSSDIFSEQSVSYEIVDVLNNLFSLEFINKENLSRDILNRLLDMLEKDIKYSLENLISEYIEVIIKNTPITSWEVLSIKLLEAEGIYKYRLNNILGNKFFKEESSVLQYIPVEFLKEWAKGEQRAPQVLADIYPINLKGSNDLIEHLIINYGRDEMVLGNVDRQLRTFSWSGSLIPYFEGLIRFYKKYVQATPPVRHWALKNIHYLEQDIKKEKIKEEEEDLRF